jgi:hypothetical protein
VRVSGALVACAVPAAAILVVGAALRGRLGPTMASHWSAGSAPDGFAATWPTFWGLTAATVALAGVGAVLVALWRRVPQGRVWAGLAVMVAGEIAAAWIATAWATVAAADPAHAELGWKMGLLLVGVACGAAVYLLLPAAPAPVPRDHPAPAVELGDGDRLAWTGTTGSRFLLAVGVILAGVFVASLVVLVRSHGANLVVLTVVSFLAAFAVLSMSYARLTVDARGIRVASAVLGIPFVRVRLQNVAAVMAEDIDPLRWGGWGLRLSSAGLAVVTRRGPGVVVTRRSGGAIAVTVDRPEQAAAVAEALVARAAGAPPFRR